LKFAPLAIPAMTLLQQHDARWDIVIEPAVRRRAAIEAHRLVHIVGLVTQHISLQLNNCASLQHMPGTSLVSFTKYNSHRDTVDRTDYIRISKLVSSDLPSSMFELQQSGGI